VLEQLVDSVPRWMFPKSGSVFYSGRSAFASRSKLYILGLNPGGSPVAQVHDTVERQMSYVLSNFPSDWSAYSDESWLGRPPGTVGLQPRVLHMLRQLALDPRQIPSSNLIFLRSSNEAGLADKENLAAQCWAMHQHVIENLGIRVVLCFGGTPGRLVGRRVGATRQVGEWVEQNARLWRSVAHANSDRLVVITATHPSRADWTSPGSDPTPLVREVLAAV